ncbi:MAG: TIGR04086 family membrane protein [Oscillospiraceae bacterium]|nr:TIGR04086 family membrane protein [Oscillospiraceae bacterium]
MHGKDGGHNGHNGHKKSRQTRQNRQGETAQLSWVMLVRRILLCSAVGAGVFFVLLLVAAGVCLRTDLSQRLLPLVSIPAAGFSAGVAGYLGVRPTRRQGLVMGVLTVLPLYLCLLGASLIAVRGGAGIHAIILLLVQLISGGLGGIFAANRPVRRR